MAAGLRLSSANLDAFAAAFIADANAAISQEQLTLSLCVDCDARVGDLTADAVTELEKLAPYGPGNPRPRVRLIDARLAMRPEPLGAAGTHLKLLAKCQRSGTVLRIVAWNWGARRDELAQGMEIEAVVTPKISTWNGTSRVEGELSDVRVCEAAEARDRG